MFFLPENAYEKGLFWLLLILRGAFLAEFSPAYRPEVEPFCLKKKPLAHSKLPFLSMFPVLLLPPQSAAPTANTDPYAPTFPPIFPGRGAFFARSYFLERDRRAFFV